RRQGWPSSGAQGRGQVVVERLRLQAQAGHPAQEQDRLLVEEVARSWRRRAFRSRSTGAGSSSRTSTRSSTPPRASPRRRSSPTMVVFDLDPGEPAGVLQCAEVALLVRDALDALDLRAVIKTSGSKGLQLYVPVNRAAPYEAAKEFAHSLARLLEKQHPDLV